MEAAAVGDLGLTIAEFWEMTPRHLLAAYRRFEAAEERADRRTAFIVATLANAHRDSRQHPEPFTIEDFMPRHGAGQTSQPIDLEKLPLDQRVAWVTKMRTSQSMAEQMHNVTAALESVKIRANGGRP